MIHQPSGGSRGQCTDIQIQAEQILKIKQRLNRILADNTGKSIEEIERDCERDYFMSADEAQEYGLIDKVIVKR
jgi:ATP-dependent Clp protease protease subunit